MIRLWMIYIGIEIWYNIYFYLIYIKENDYICIKCLYCIEIFIGILFWLIFLGKWLYMKKIYLYCIKIFI